METILYSANNPDLTYSPSTLKYFPRILRGRRKNEEYTERNILGWKGLVPLMLKILENWILGIYMDINRTISNLNFFDI